MTQTVATPAVDLDGLRRAIQDEYGLVAQDPEHGIVLANEAVDLMTGPVAENLVPFGWPAFKEILAETLSAKMPIHV